MIGMLDAIEKEVILGQALVQEVFKVSKVGTIAGCRVTEGLVRTAGKSANHSRRSCLLETGDIDSL
jgi:translation initiation factor IF-2